MGDAGSALAALKARRAAARSSSGLSAEPGPSSAAPSIAPETVSKLAWAWRCNGCERECVPVRDECRCLCGHRLKEHAAPTTEGRRDALCRAPPIHSFSAQRISVVRPRPGDMPRPRRSGQQSRCSAARCECSGFFFLVAEGSWMLRCRCKHKGVEHNAKTRVCAKAGCSCSLFDSPWVCNCGHAWGEHTQLVQRKEVVKMSAAAAAAALAVAAEEVNDIDGIRRGL